MQKRGDILFDLRKQRNIKQSTIADILDISQQAYLKYEHGDADPTLDALCKLADFYGVSTDYLLGRTSVKRMATEEFDPLADIDVSELDKRLIKKYTNFSQSERALCVELLRQLTTIFDDEQQPAEKPRQRLVQRLGDIEDELEQERQAKEKDVI
ncbi:MAG: helix-turn-helix domain-containing protein [Ruminococcus sp.]|nr:helix-turn-helix domain-containing protein [Ruminococcus sp.]